MKRQLKQEKKNYAIKLTQGKTNLKNKQFNKYSKNWVGNNYSDIGDSQGKSNNNIILKEGTETVSDSNNNRKKCLFV